MRPSPALLAARRAHARICYEKGMMPAPAPRRLNATPNPAKAVAMARRKASAAPKIERRPRGEIDRNYYFGDVFIKTGVAVAVALAMIALYTPFSLRDAVNDGMYDYLAVMGTFAVIAVGCFLFGRHLRREATQWDFD